MGKIITTKRGNYWQYRFEGAIVDGKRKWISKSGFRTKADALTAGAKAQAEYEDAGQTFKPSEMSVADYFDYWIDAYCKVNLKDTTVEGYQKKIRLYIKPAFGNYYLKSITPSIIQDFINDKFNEGFSRNTLVSIKALLSGAFDYAVEPCQFIKFNPATAVRMPSKRAEPNNPTRKKIKRPVTDEEWQKIMNRFPEGEPAHIPLTLAYTTGMRLGEIFGLQWEDIDFENNLITINRQVQRLEGEEYWSFTPPKYDSYRTIAVDHNTMQLLKREHDKQIKAKAYYDEYYIELYDDSGKLCTHGTHIVHMVMIRESGEYIQPRIMQHVGRIIHGVYNKNNPCISKDFDFHSLRITHASTLLSNGVPLPLIQERLGHTKIDMTEHYTKPTEKMKSDLLQTISKLY